MNNPTQLRPINILLVEDNPTDVMLTKQALKHAKVINTLYVATDGIKAMEFLRSEAGNPETPRPDLILLDLNMPRMNGQEVLAEIKTDENLKSIPVVILTTSAAETDVARAYKHHANSYITKPVDFEGFVEVIHSIQGFWVCVVTLPPP
jgi:chemotaxis family two-component system response regulator Rcp1